MKNIIITVLLAATVALGAWCVVQRNKTQSQAAQLAQTETRLASVEAQLKERTEAIEKAKFAETKARILQDTLSATAANALEKSNQIAQLQDSLATAKTNGANPLAAMFKDPKMKEMIKSQQKLVMGPMIDKSYAQLFKQLNLTPEQTASLKELLQSKMLVAADMGMSMMDGSLDATKRAELGKQIKTDTEAYDAQIKQFLGDDNYKAFEGYEKTIPDRMAVGQFSDQLAGSATPMSSDQQQQLIQAMTEERTGFKWTTDYSNKNPGDTDFAQMFSEDRMSQFAQEKAQFDQQFLVRAKQILSPEQYTAYEQFQAAQRELQINAMKMAAKMFSQ
jgi:hypothetical protein